MDQFGEGLDDDFAKESQQESSDKQTMIARSDDPRIGVHTLTEFIFCPRAGLISYEQQGEDQGEDKPAIYLNYLPQYDLIRMTSTWNQLFKKIVTGLIVFMFLPLLLLLGDWIRWILLFQAAALFVWLLGLFRDLWILGRRIKVAEKAIAWKPDPHSNEQQDVDWWQLLKAGFVSHRYEEPLVDSLWKLSGNPWRVLAFENLRIPVFRFRQYKGQLYPQHLARMAAYCQLIERTTGAASPYGIILLGNTFQGISIPQSRENQNLFYWQMAEFRKTLRNLAKERIIPAEPSPKLCLHCPIGKPLHYKKGRTVNKQFGRVLPPCIANGRSIFIRYHSACGDRYSWLPPHKQANGKKLKLMNQQKKT